MPSSKSRATSFLITWIGNEETCDHCYIFFYIYLRCSYCVEPAKGLGLGCSPVLNLMVLGGLEARFIDCSAIGVDTTITVVLDRHTLMLGQHASGTAG